MKLSELKYDLSTDYDKLYHLLKDGNNIVGFFAISMNNVPDMEYSTVTMMSYNRNFKTFDIGLTLFEIDFDKTDFMEICKNYNIKYFDLN